MRITISVALTFLAFAVPLAADELQIELDPERTSISFRLRATLHTVHGSAALADGSLRLDTESGAMTGAVTIDATTAETGNKKRDKKMHGKVLLTAEYPEVVLQGRRLEGELAPQGVSDVTMHGEIEILGQSHEIGIQTHIEIDGENFVTNFEFVVPYVDWGLKDPSTFLLRVAKVVEVTVTARGTVR